MLNLSLIAAAENQPLEIDEVKAHLRITGTDEDDYLAGVILPSAVASVEDALSRPLVTQTWEWVWDGGFPAAGMLQFPLPPLIGVTHVKYKDTDGVEQTWAASNYNVEVRGMYGRLWLADGVTWPTVQDNVPGVAWVRFTCGYGTDGDDIPGPIRNLVLLMCGHLYQNREPTITGSTITEVPLAWLSLVMQNRALDFVHAP
tara:strand:- start:664 stop:1266 length:603 start_codon:yes stop_codon:yes gene_type:complete